ncbi:tRNA (N6-threonylcarbamoyladenosine(37)-N6)-methyltransferase TrmO [Agaribacterium haliotis]|uniref:tRNA (N6-threonylcarbamoyladenosine(37)-N6)-methyltransferase TrmO n=1 Tax=Agaribacterium haliotis TaxID=2013869 RepID=UPI000BB589C0|nr:tRNA (N6-threonylcarbamoyladenosine(37)-N6)-methyltransferase TrmO [Agaribacterium haliotis]
MTQTDFVVQPLGFVHSCFKEKFGIPRQPGLVSEAKAKLVLQPPFNRAECVEGLASCSHLWLHFIFHGFAENAWKPTVRPPRLGGNKRMGVFATRAPNRPNRLGLSVVKLESIDLSDGVCLNLSGVDLLDATPVVDIKPYVPYVDVVNEASNTFADEPPPVLAVVFSRQAELALAEREKLYQEHQGIKLKRLIVQVLQQDPRPRYQHYDPSRIYAMHLLDFDLKWSYRQSAEAKLELVVVSLDDR